jgi:hypothetical protein
MAGRPSSYTEEIAGARRDWQRRCVQVRRILANGPRKATDQDRETVKQFGRDAVALYRATQ